MMTGVGRRFGLQLDPKVTGVRSKSVVEALTAVRGSHGLVAAANTLGVLWRPPVILGQCSLQATACLLCNMHADVL